MWLSAKGNALLIRENERCMSLFCDTVVVVVCFVCRDCVLFSWWCGLVHQRFVFRGAARRWEAAQRVFLFLTAPRQQATPIGSGGRSRCTPAPPTQTLWFTHLDAVSRWFKKENTHKKPVVKSHYNHLIVFPLLCCFCSVHQTLPHLLVVHFFQLMTCILKLCET